MAAAAVDQRATKASEDERAALTDTRQRVVLELLEVALAAQGGAEYYARVGADGRPDHCPGGSAGHSTGCNITVGPRRGRGY